jgi:cytochrome c-type biogenesis protein CcmH
LTIHPSLPHFLSRVRRAVPRPGGLWAVAALLLALAAGVPAQEVPTPTPEGEASVNAMILIGEPLGEPLSGAELDQLTEDVSGVIRCPVCQGLSVADSPSKTAVALKREVRELLAAGYTPEQTLSYFEQAYGEFIRLEPKAEGFNLVVWVAPVLALLAGIMLLVLRFLRSPRASQEELPADDPSLEEYREQVRREVSS